MLLPLTKALLGNLDIAFSCLQPVHVSMEKAGSDKNRDPVKNIPLHRTLVIVGCRSRSPNVEVLAGGLVAVHGKPKKGEER